MFSLTYKLNGGYNSTTLLVKSEEYANAYLDLVSQTSVIDEVTLTYVPNYKPSNRMVYATSRSLEQQVINMYKRLCILCARDAKVSKPSIPALCDPCLIALAQRRAVTNVTHA